MDYYWYGHSVDDVHTTTDKTETQLVSNQSHAQADVDDRSRSAKVRLVRLVNSAVHALPCLVLLALLGSAMRVLRKDIGNHTG